MQEPWLIGLGIAALLLALVFLPILFENLLGGLLALILTPLLNWVRRMRESHRGDRE